MNKAEAKAKATKKRAKSKAKTTATTTTACTYYSSISISRSLAAAGQRRSSHLLMGFALSSSSSKLELIFNDEQKGGDQRQWQRECECERGCERERNNIIKTAKSLFCNLNEAKPRAGCPPLCACCCCCWHLARIESVATFSGKHTRAHPHKHTAHTQTKSVSVKFIDSCRANKRLRQRTQSSLATVFIFIPQHYSSASEIAC